MVRGKILQLNVRCQRTNNCEDHRNSMKTWDELETTSGSIAGAIFFDIRRDSTGCYQLWCLPVCSDPAYSVVVNPYRKRSSAGDQSGATVIGVALQKIDEVGNVFQRVGMFC